MSDTPRKRLIRDTSAPIDERRAAFRAHNRDMDPETYPSTARTANGADLDRHHAGSPASIETPAQAAPVPVPIIVPGRTAVEIAAALDHLVEDIREHDADAVGLGIPADMLPDHAAAVVALAAAVRPPVEPAPPAGIDHDERARNLRALIAHAYKFNAECFDETGDGFDWGDEDDPAWIPFRYACLTHDGSSSWLVVGDTLDEIRSALVEGLVAEYPFTPGEGVDLDTNRRLDARVAVSVTITDELTPVIADRKA